MTFDIEQTKIVYKVTIIEEIQIVRVGEDEIFVDENGKEWNILLSDDERIWVSPR